MIIWLIPLNICNKSHKIMNNKAITTYIFTLIFVLICLFSKNHHTRCIYHTFVQQKIVIQNVGLCVFMSWQTIKVQYCHFVCTQLKKNPFFDVSWWLFAISLVWWREKSTNVLTSSYNVIWLSVKKDRRTEVHLVQYFVTVQYEFYANKSKTCEI